MQIITITGNLGRDAEIRQAGSSDVCSFSVGVKQGWGDKASSNWFRCDFWGKAGTGAQPYLRKGGMVTVVGQLTIGEYQGKPQYDVRVLDLQLSPRGEAPQRSEQSRGGGGGGQQRAATNFDDLDDNVPFVTFDPAYEPDIRRKMVL